VFDIVDRGGQRPLERRGDTSDIWSGGKPVYCQTTPITGIRMSGKMSVGVRTRPAAR